ncbi:MAG: transporter substrate-binding domain-containing protein [Verrucomicrobia bacterium]|nr:transporter substrate-binding domain-containing protein [Leptolyngbya sp. ES-bin-22]
MKRRSLLTLSLTTIVAITALASCEPPQPGQNATSSSGKKVLTMITSPEYPPYEYYDTGSGERKIVGFDIDIANKIASDLGYELKINESDFNGLIPALQAKRADFVIAGMTPTPERQKNVDFSTIYYEAKNTIIAPKSSNLKTTKDLAGKTVGVQLGSIQEGDAKKIAEKVPGMKVKQLNKVPDLIQEIKAKRIDAAIVEDTVAKGFTDASTDLVFNVIPSEGPSGSAVAFPKGSPLVADFNKVLEKMKASGEIKTLAAKWFATSAPPSPSPSPSGSMSPSPSKAP